MEAATNGGAGWRVGKGFWEEVGTRPKPWDGTSKLKDGYYPEEAESAQRPRE